MSGSYIYNRLVASPGNELLLGSEGGALLLSPPGNAAGAMTLTTMCNRVWHLLRENGPDNGFPPPTINSDFPQQVVIRDLNIALAQYVSDTGLAPDIADRMASFPVFAVLDYPVPPDLLSVTKIEYNQVGGMTWTLIGKSMQEYDELTGFQVVQPETGPPQYFRQPFAGYVRLFPQPGPQQANGGPPGSGTIYVNGLPAPGDTFTVSVTDGTNPVSVSYGAISGDTAITVATALSALLNQSPAVTQGSAYLQQTQSNGNQIPLMGLNSMAVFYSCSYTSAKATMQPTSTTQLEAIGDTMTWYYQSSCKVLVNPGDAPGIPILFHMAPVYRVLSDYWARKNDGPQSVQYMQKYDRMVKAGKQFTFDVNRATQIILDGDDPDDYGWYGGPGGPGYW